MAKRPIKPMHLSPPFEGPRGYCKEGHPIALMSVKRPPGDLDTIKLPRESKELLERQALDIFTLMSNAGHSFADCLASILLTGMDWGVKGLEKLQEREDNGSASKHTYNQSGY